MPPLVAAGAPDAAMPPADACLGVAVPIPLAPPARPPPAPDRSPADELRLKYKRVMALKRLMREALFHGAVARVQNGAFKHTIEVLTRSGLIIELDYKQVIKMGACCITEKKKAFSAAKV